MERQILLSNDMEGQAEDIVALQDHAQNRDDHIVLDGISASLSYVGFQITSVSATEIQVAKGRLYNEGRTYARDEDVTLNLFSHLPLATKKTMAIIGWGQELEHKTTTRDFLTNSDTGVKEPRPVDTEKMRYTNIDKVEGIESATPQQPSVDATQCIIGWVTLDTSGIIDIKMNDAALLPSVSKNAMRVSDLEKWKQRTGQQVETLASDMAGLAASTSDAVDQETMEALQFDVARVREVLELPATYNNYGAEYFQHDEDSDVDRPGFDCDIEQGLHFADDNADVALISLFNQYDDNVKTYENGLVLPKHKEEIRIQATGYSGSSSLTEYSVRTWALLRRHHSRWRKRSGRRYVDWKGVSRLNVLKRTKVGTNGEPPNTRYPAAPLVFRKRKQGELKTVFQKQRRIKNHGRWKYSANGKWARGDWWSEPYWSFIRSDISVDGALRAQSFLNSQDGWLTKVGLFFVTKAPAGDVKVLVTDVTDQGTPDIESVLSETTLSHNDILVSASGQVETKVPLTPVFFQTGKRYAIVLMSQGAHWVALADQVSFNSGTYFNTGDGAYFSGSQTQDMKFNAYFAAFEDSYIEVNLSALNLSGGIANIDLLGEGFVPEASSMTFLVRPSGGEWERLEAYDELETTGPFQSLPPLLEFKVVLNGTREVMPGVNLAQTQQYISRQKTSLSWFSEAVTLSAGSDTFTAKLILNAFEAANHTCDISIEDQANAGTWIAADTMHDRALNNGQIERTFTWVLGTAANDIAFKIAGTTIDALHIWNVEEMSWIAA